MLEKIYDFLFFLFSGLCHQIPERSFYDIYGHQFFVCARDTGTYIGFLLSFIILYLLSFTFKKDQLNTLIIENIRYIIFLFLFYLFLFGLDGVTSYTNLRETTNSIRFFTGLFMASHLGLIYKYFEIFINKTLITNENLQSTSKEKDNVNNNENPKRNSFILFIITFNLLLLIFYFISLKVLIPYLLYVLAFAIIFYFYKTINLITSLIHFQFVDPYVNNKFLRLLPNLVFITIFIFLLLFLFSTAYVKKQTIIQIYKDFYKKYFTN